MNTKKLLHAVELDYITNKVCKPLEFGNSQPFYRHLKQSQGTAKPPIKLLCTDGPTQKMPENVQTCFTAILVHNSVLQTKVYTLSYPKSSLRFLLMAP